MSHDDFDFEPIRGLPALLPPGEKLLWQGQPLWRTLAVRAYHVRKVAGYFLILVLWRISIGLGAHHAPAAIARSCVLLLVLGGVAIGILALLAYLNARSTVYSITSARVLLRHGIAVPLTLDVPLTLVDNVALKSSKDGRGDIALTLTRRQRVGYLINWPHVRPGRFANPEPCFRALADAASAARTLEHVLRVQVSMAAEVNAAPSPATAAVSASLSPPKVRPDYQTAAA